MARAIASRLSIMISRSQAQPSYEVPIGGNHRNVLRAGNNDLRLCLPSVENGYQPIYLFRYDSSTGEVFILAGINENIELKVYHNGLWKFNDDETEL